MRFPKIPVPKSVQKIFWKVALKTKARKPEICLIAGVAAGTAAIVYTGIEVWRNKDKLQADVDKIAELKAIPEDTDDENTVLVSEEEKTAEIRKAYARFGKDIFITFWKPVVLSGTSAFLIVTGHRSLRRQLGEMTAAYAALWSAYKQYRQNVVDELGLDADQKFMGGYSEEERVDAETGEVTTVVVPNASRMGSPYARWITEGEQDENGNFKWKNKVWSRHKSTFINNLQLAQVCMNQRLDLRGKLWLFEVKEELGMPVEAEDMHVGWVKGSNGDGYVDFGIFDTDYYGRPNAHQLPVNKAFLDSESNQEYPLIDFNVDGCIDYIFKDICEYDRFSYVAGQKRKQLKAAEA